MKGRRHEHDPPLGPELEARRSQRLRTIEVLAGGRTPLQLVAAADSAAEFADQALTGARKPSEEMACQEGCAWCCHKKVGTALAEVVRIVDHLRRHCSADELEEIRRRAERLAEERRALRAADSWAADRLPCPLLADQRCLVYPVRPLTCRGFLSRSAWQCEQSYRRRGTQDVPLHQPSLRLATFILDGLRAGLAESRQAGDLLDLTAALAIALSEPDAVERSIRGEPVFALARMD